MTLGYKLLVNRERTVLVRIWDNGTTEVSTRDHPGETWGPPVEVKDEDA